jgi:hypothetical protein
MRAAMSEGGRIIAEITTYHGFTAAIRQWIAELDTNYACVNDLAGLQDGYLAKLMPIRNFGPTSLSPVLGALGLKLLLVIDEEKLRQMRPRYVKRKKHACDEEPENIAFQPSARPTLRSPPRFNPDAGAAQSDCADCGACAVAEWRTARQRNSASALNPRPLTVPFTAWNKPDLI